MNLAPIFAFTLFAGMLGSTEIGRRIGIRLLDQDSPAARASMGIVEGASFALLGLLLAFSFSGAATRFDLRRSQIVEEANDIGTAYLRLDLLAPNAQPELRTLFRRYLTSRLAAFEKLPDLTAAMDELAKSTDLQRQIWRNAVTATTAAGAHPSAAMLTLPALNQMIDITTTRTMTARTHPPALIYGLLFVLGLTSAAIAGYSMSTSQRRPWAHSIGFALITAITVFVILDVEYPRLGFVRIDSHDRVLIDLLESFK